MQPTDSYAPSDEVDPYRPPETDAENPHTQPLAAVLADKELKKLYRLSRYVAAVGRLSGLLLVLTTLLLMASPSVVQEGADIVAFVMHLALYLIIVVCAFKRLGIARVIGMIACILQLIVFPIGSVLGVVGLVVFGFSSKLFGPRRYTHSALKEEWRRRKVRKAVGLGMG